jgi:hypothetical protein
MEVFPKSRSLLIVACVLPTRVQEHGFSSEALFTAAPPVGPSTHVKVLALADLGQAEQDGSMESEEYTHNSLNTTSKDTPCTVFTHAYASLTTSFR